jgi:hypothetical protein
MASVHSLYHLIRSWPEPRQHKALRVLRYAVPVMMVMISSVFWVILLALFLERFDPDQVFGELMMPGLLFWGVCLLLGRMATTGLLVFGDKLEHALTPAGRGLMQTEIDQAAKARKWARIRTGGVCLLVWAGLTFGFFMPFFQKHAPLF